MPIENTNRVGIRISEESAWGEDIPTGPGPTMLEMRYTGGSLAPSKETVASDILRTDRQRDDLAEVAAAAAGNLNFELLFGAEWDLLLGLTLFNSFTTIDTTGVDCSAAVGVPSAGQVSFAFTGANPLTDGVLPGHRVQIKATWPTNPAAAVLEVISVSASTIVCYDPNGVFTTTEASTAGTAEYHVNSIRNGVTPRSILLEQAFSGVSRFRQFTGLRVGSLSLNLTARQIVTGTINFEGKQLVTPSATSVADSVTAAGATNVMTASANVGKITRGGALLALPLRGIQLQIGNNLDSVPVVGSKFPEEVGEGFLDVTGTVDAYYNGDESMMGHFLNHTDTDLSFEMTDGAGNLTGVTLPRKKFSEAPTNVAGGNERVTTPFGFTSIRDTARDYTIQIDRLAA